MSLMIRPVAPADRPDWEALFRGYAAFYKTDPAPVLEAVWGWITDPAEPYWADIAWGPDGAALGLVQYSLMHRSLSGGQVVYLSDLFSVPQARGQGVGRALIEHVRGFARARGYPSVRWLTAEDNAAARRLYDSYAPASGFILYSIAP
ncbi:MAG: GNAT family N-acetyltransferase [Sphingomonadales bacterium]|nr:GNAT family N-acetyltransferase [Sphingomonadales bacterium]